MNIQGIIINDVIITLLLRHYFHIYHTLQSGLAYVIKRPNRLRISLEVTQYLEKEIQIDSDEK